MVIKCTLGEFVDKQSITWRAGLLFRGPWTGWRGELTGACEVQQMSMHFPAPGSELPTAPAQAGGWLTWKQLCRKDQGVLLECGMCPCNNVIMDCVTKTVSSRREVISSPFN